MRGDVAVRIENVDGFVDHDSSRARCDDDVINDSSHRVSVVVYQNIDLDLFDNLDHIVFVCHDTSFRKGPFVRRSVTMRGPRARCSCRVREVLRNEVGPPKV